MKIRNGFVSNSSAASFIIDWDCASFYRDDEKATFNEAFAKLFDLTYDDEKDEIVWNMKRDEKYKKIYDFVKEITVTNSDKTFTTTFHTYMLNDLMDFGEVATCFWLALSQKNNMEQYNMFKTIFTHIERNN